MVDEVKNKLDALTSACKEHKVVSLALFGSAARQDMNESSDVDLLVGFSDEIQAIDYADNYFSLLDRLQAILGRKVDLVSIKALKNPVFKAEVFRSKIELYAA